MTDRRLRELERRLAEGDAAAEAPLLAERLRAGTLAPERLRLAAYLAHAPARDALADAAPRLREDLEGWIRGLAEWGPQAWVRAAVAAARRVLSLYEERFEAPGSFDLRPREAIEAAELWLRQPSPDTLLSARAHAAAVMEVSHPAAFAEGPRVHAGVFRESRAAVQAALSATDEPRGVTHAVLAGVAARERLGLAELPDDSPMWVRAANVGRLGELPELSTRAAVAGVREAVREELLPWALGG